MNWRRFVICALFGWFGVHKFMEKKIGMGLLYLFTFGLFGIGWIIDTIRYLIIAIKGVKNKGNITLIGAILLLIAMKANMNGSDDAAVISSSMPSADTQITATMCMTVTPTVEPIMEATAELTATPTAEPTAAPTKAPTMKPTAAPTKAPTMKPTAAPTKEEVSYIGNRNSGIFHKPSCGSVKRMKESNKVYFYGARSAVIDRGYDPCDNCRP